MHAYFLTGYVLHELMHTAGFWHEHSRADRDDYIEIIWDNIREESKGNFDKYTSEQIDHLGAKYDKCSLMHYSTHSDFPLTKVFQFSLGGCSYIMSYSVNQNMTHNDMEGGGGMTKYDVQGVPKNETGFYNILATKYWISIFFFF